MFSPESRILIVEDTDISRAILKKMLEKIGFRKINESVNGEEAWGQIQKSLNFPFTVIIADWNMPKMNGLELLKCIQTLPQLKNTAFIMLTSNTEKEHVITAIKAGVSLYLAKPFTSASLEKKLKEAYEFYGKKKAG